MSEAEIFYFSQASLMLIFYLSMPVIGIATLVGLVVAMLQTLIQLQEQTLGFGVKLIAILVVLGTTSGWMASELLAFFEQIFQRIGAGV